MPVPIYLEYLYISMFARVATTMQFLGRRSYIHACGRRWGSADALLYGVLE
eukprot:COSAG06_NODE_31246_length_524_cov_1.896471_1_plen_50_part_10